MRRSDHRPGPLLPAGDGRDFALFAVVAILCLLACLGAMAASASDRAAQGWVRDIRSEATVQISPRPDETGAQAAARAAEILSGVPGVTEAAALERERAEALLEPWLGEAILSDLPLPHLVTIRLDPEDPASPEALNRALAEAGLQGRVDDHSVWLADVERAALTATIGAIVLCVLAALAAAAAVVFASRAGLTARRGLIATLSLTGATEGYIAGLFQARFAWLAAVAGAAGGLMACGVVAVLILIGGGDGFTPALPLAWADLLIAAPAPLLAAGLAALAARFTVSGLLRDGADLET